MRNFLRTSTLALAFVGSVGIAAAQQQPPPADPQRSDARQDPAWACRFAELSRPARRQEVTRTRAPMAST